MALFVSGLLLSSAVPRAGHGAAIGGYSAVAGVTGLTTFRTRSQKGDDDWMVFEVVVLRDGNPIFRDRRDGELTQSRPLKSIQSGQVIELTDQQQRWVNPFFISFQLQSTDVVVARTTILNQSHESYDPDAQRKKWGKFVTGQDNAIGIAKLIALPIGVGPLVDTVGDIYVGLLKAVGTIWDLVSPPMGHDVNCDGIVFAGYWKFTAEELVARASGPSKGHFSDRGSSPDKPASECGSPPDTEVRYAVGASPNPPGSFGPPGPRPQVTFKTVTGASPAAWYGERVEHVYVRDSKYDVWIGPMPRNRLEVWRGPRYQVSVRERANPGAAQWAFQMTAPNLEATVGAPARRPTGPAISPHLETTEVLQVGNGVTLYLYAVYSNAHLLDYAVRYVREANGAAVADIVLRQALKPLQ